MATITTEFGKLSSKGQRAVYLRVRDKKTEKRIATGVKVDESEISPRTKKIKNFEKAQAVEKMRMELMYKMTSIAPEINYSANMDAARIVSTLVMQEKTESLDFFTFAEDWISKNSLKSTKNYKCTLSALESYLGVRKLDFSQINYTLLKNFELYLSDRPRAKSMYLGYMRHLYREAMLEYNTDEVTVIKNDPFMRYKAPKQVLKKGVRALSVQDILKVYHYKGIDPKGRPQLARDCFILSFCLMGMNSADLYNATVLQKGVVKYNRTKTKDRRSDDAYIEVKVHPFIKQLMKKYAGNTHVFNFYQRYAGFEEMNTALNKGLKEVGKAIGIPKLQFYQARHTFATLSRNMMKFSKSDVDEALNHVGSYDIADVYITKDFSIINENNYKLIDRVFDLEPTPMGIKALAVPKKTKQALKKSKAVSKEVKTTPANV